MNRLVAPTTDEEASILQKALEFAREENKKIQGILKTVSRSSNVPIIPSTSVPISAANVANLAIFGRIYIGSINFELTEKDIEAVFSVFGPLKSIQMMYDPTTKRHRGYGFLEFETPDAASLAIQMMDNSEFGGRFIKAGRPSNFPSDLPPGVPRPLPNRLYVGNVHELIQEEELKAVFEAFGPLKHCNLIPDTKSEGRHRGYGYVEYEVVADAINAMNSLNNFELAGRQLKIGKTIVGGSIPIGMKDVDENKKILSEVIGTDAVPAPLLTTKVPTAVLLAAQKINASLETTLKTTPQPPVQVRTSPILVLIDLVDLAELDDPRNEFDLQQDIYDECSKFGKIICPVKIYGNTKKQIVCAFVRFEHLESCSEAVSRMNGRWFGGRQLTAKAYPIENFDNNDFERI